MMRKALALTLATAAGAIAFSGVATADPIGTPTTCTRTADVTGPDFDVKLCGVSDVDQFRAGLEWNGGAYCGPTSLYNVLHYWGHVKNAPVGWLSTKVKNLDPQDPADYNVITNSIGRIGVDAKYDGKTNLTDLRNAWQIATKPARDNGWKTAAGGVNSKDTADFFGELAKRLDGGPVQLVYGRYSAGPQGSLKRGGGHIVTVVAAKGSFNGGTVQLKLADPGRAADHGDAGYLSTQSDYQLLDVVLSRRSVFEYIPVQDDENTDVDESKQPGTYRTVERWQLTGPQYIASTTQLVEAFNWFSMDAPNGSLGH